jgi:hypothetical protein
MHLCLHSLCNASRKCYRVHWAAESFLQVQPATYAHLLCQPEFNERFQPGGCLSPTTDLFLWFALRGSTPGSLQIFLDMSGISMANESRILIALSSLLRFIYISAEPLYFFNGHILAQRSDRRRGAAGFIRWPILALCC